MNSPPSVAGLAVPERVRSRDCRQRGESAVLRERLARIDDLDEIAFLEVREIVGGRDTVKRYSGSV